MRLLLLYHLLLPFFSDNFFPKSQNLITLIIIFFFFSIIIFRYHHHSSMARQLSQTLTRFSSSSSSSSFLKLLPNSLSSQFLSHPRNYFSTKGRLIEVDLDYSSDNAGEVEVLGLKKLEDAIHSIIVRRLAPDWLPFRPGSSYWVPPKRNADNIVELVEKLTNPLTEEETLSLTSDRGFPSSSFFVKGPGSGPVIPVEVEVHVLKGKPTVSEDEE